MFQKQNLSRQDSNLSPLSRDKSIDVIKGLAILSVIIGHVTAIGPLRHLVCSYHVPLFFFASGYFYKEYKTSVLGMKLFKSLIIPYFIACIALFISKKIAGESYSILEYLTMIVFADGYYNKTMIGADMPIIGKLWFLPALFWCRIVYNKVAKVPCNLYYVIAITVFSYLCGRYVVNLPFGILEGTQGLMMYAFGRYANNYKKYFAKRFAVLISLILWGYHLYLGGFSMADFAYRNFIINYLGAISACIIILLGVKKYHSKTCLKLPSMALSWCGTNSIYIYIYHAVTMPLYTNWNVIEQIVVSVGCAYIYVKTINKKI